MYRDDELQDRTGCEEEGEEGEEGGKGVYVGIELYNYLVDRSREDDWGLLADCICWLGKDWVITSLKGKLDPV